MADGFMLLGVNQGYQAEAVVAELRQTSGIMFANKVYVDSDSMYFYPTDLIYLHFLPSSTDTQIDSLMDALELDLVDSLFGDHFVRIARMTGDTPYDVVTAGNRAYESELLSQANASFAMPWETFDAPDDDYYDYQWHLHNDGSGGGTAGADIDYENAREYYMPTTTFTIGVVDDGFESHPDLPANRIIGGWDYFASDADVTPGDYKAHGMGCAGILASNTDNTEGTASLTGYNVQIVGQKIFADLCPPSPFSCAATNAMIGLALDSCRIKGAKVISNSWGRACLNCPPAPEIDEAISRCDSAGVHIIFSAGNCYGCSWVGHPARQPEVIAVGATDRSDDRWNYSMYGSELDVVAPSGDVSLNGDIWTLDREGNYGYNPSIIECDPDDVDYDCAFGGTSAACPQVSGIVTLLLLRRPDLIGETEQIREIIRYSSERSQYGGNGTSRVNNYVGWGRVNAAQALLSVVRGDANNDGLVNISDATYLINFIGGGAYPVPVTGTGDANCDGLVNITDAVFLIQYIYNGGPAPYICYKYSY